MVSDHRWRDIREFLSVLREFRLTQNRNATVMQPD